MRARPETDVNPVLEFAELLAQVLEYHRTLKGY